MRYDWDVLLVIAAGGALGSLGRWGLGEWLPAHGDGFPWATCIENVSGSFALGLLMVFLVDVWPPSRFLRPFLAIGVLGGYTTFSTYTLDARDLIADGHVATAGAYVVGTLVAAVVAVAAGLAAARWIVGLGPGRNLDPRRNP